MTVKNLKNKTKPILRIRVIVDHVRAVAFAIADGQCLPMQNRICDSAYFTSLMQYVTVTFLNIKRTFYQLVAV
jgi:hypothetical protein